MAGLAAIAYVIRPLQAADESIGQRGPARRLTRFAVCFADDAFVHSARTVYDRSCAEGLMLSGLVIVVLSATACVRALLDESPPVWRIIMMQAVKLRAVRKVCRGLAASSLSRRRSGLGISLGCDDNGGDPKISGSVPIRSAAR